MQRHFLGGSLPYGPRRLGTNAFLISPYLRVTWIEPVLWSLAVEEVFYLIAATAAWRGLLASRLFIVLAAVGLTVASVATRNVDPGGVLSWLGFFATFVIFILIGVVFHHLYRGTWGRADSVVLIATIFGLWAFAINKPGQGPLPTIYILSSTAALVIFGGLFLARDRLPYSSSLDRLSNISYPLYLLHGVNGYIVIRAVYALTANYYLGAASAVIAAVTVATGIHFLVEKPTNELGRRLSRRMRTRASLGDREPVAPVAPVAAMLDPVDQVGTSTASA